MGELMDGAMQQVPHWGRQCMGGCYCGHRPVMSKGGYAPRPNPGETRTLPGAAS
jgi:hypothetical protein